jgi:transposase InsO family protein
MAPDFEDKLVARMTALAEQHPRWGYRPIHNLLVEQGWAVNKKRIERLWRQEGLQVPPQRLKSRGARRSATRVTARRTCRRCIAITSGPMTS